jgi:hypothetical protein
MYGLIDQDIAHIARLLRPSLTGDLGGALLSSKHWRRRLHQLLDSQSLTKAQLCAIDSLLLELDEFDSGGRGVSFPQALEPANDVGRACTTEPVELHG